MLRDVIYLFSFYFLLLAIYKIIIIIGTCNKYYSDFKWKYTNKFALL